MYLRRNAILKYGDHLEFKKKIEVALVLFEQAYDQDHLCKILWLYPKMKYSGGSAVS